MKRTSLSTAALWLVAAAALVWMLFFQSLMVFNADDFYYAAFWDDGFSQFIQNTISHYQTFNGRMLVHIVAQSVLFFRSSLVCALAATATLFSISLLWCSLLARDGTPISHSIPIATVLLGLILQTLDHRLLRESLLWVSAFYNYVFPMVLLLGGLCLQRRCFRRPAPMALLALVLIQFLAGATTELYGAMAVGCALFYGLRQMITGKKPWSALLTSLVGTAFSLGGLLTVLYSPATQARMQAEVSSSGVWDVLPMRLAKLFRVLSTGRDSIQLAGLFFLLLFILALLDRRQPRLLLLSGPLLLALLLLSRQEAESSVCVLSLSGCLLLGLICLFSPTLFHPGLLLLAGLGSLALISITNSIDLRTTFPFLLALSLACIALTLPLCQSVVRRLDDRLSLPFLLVGLLAATLTAVAPDLPHYLYNHQVEQDNLARIRQSYDTGLLYYNMDYDLEYRHSPMYRNGTFLNSFYSCYHIKNTDIYMDSRQRPILYINGRRLHATAYRTEDGLYFPLVETITALGGQIAWDPVTFVSGSLSDVYFEVNADIYFDHGGTAIYYREPSPTLTNHYYPTCLKQSFYEDAFGLIFTFSQDGHRCDIALPSQ